MSMMKIIRKPSLQPKVFISNTIQPPGNTNSYVCVTSLRAPVRHPAFPRRASTRPHTNTNKHPTAITNVRNPNMTTVNYRLIDIDALDPESAFPAEFLTPQFPPVSPGEIQGLANNCRQLLQRGEQGGALVAALENVPYGADEQGKDLHLQTVLEILSSIKAVEMSPILSRLYAGPAGTELLDVLMKYLYKGMARHNTSTTPAISQHATGVSSVNSPREFGVAPSRGDGGGMSVLLSWHEKVVEIAGEGAIVRVMTDRRTV